MFCRLISMNVLCALLKCQTVTFSVSFAVANTDNSPVHNHMTQISSVSSSGRTVCCDVWWIQHRLLVNLLTPRHLNSPPCLHLPSTRLQAKTHGARRFDAFFFFLSLSSSSFFIPPYLFLPAVRLIHHVPGASPSLSVREKKSPTSLTLESDLVHCLCTVLSLWESDSRTRLIGLVHDH